MDVSVKPRLVFSRCLGFDACRYNGQTIRDDFVEKLKPYVECITVCPEGDIGMGITRGSHFPRPARKN